MFHPEGPSLIELVRQALSSTERGYDLLAKKFDHTPFRTPDELVAATMKRLGEGPPIDRAVDLCCGTGAVLGPLRRICRKEVVGVDFSEGMLREAALRLEREPGGAPYRLIKEDVLWMTLAPEFDLATCFGALGHIPYGREEAFLHAVRRVLRPGGRFVFPTAELPTKTSRAYWMSKGFNAAMHVRNTLCRPPFIMYYLRFALPGVVRDLERAGFTVETIRDILPPPDDAIALVIATKTASLSGRA